jgi:predicted nucleic acid-binding protein
VDFVAIAKRKGITLYTSEWAIYEAIPVLLQENFCEHLREQGVRSFRRIQRKVLRAKIPINVHEDLTPKIDSVHREFQIVDFDDLPPEVHQNAQKIALSSTFSSFDALHIAIAKYLSENTRLGEGGNPKVTTCYIVTDNKSDFSPTRFKTEVRDFTKNLVPIDTAEALARVKRAHYVK